MVTVLGARLGTLVENEPIIPVRKRLLSRLDNRDNESGTKDSIFYPGPVTSGTNSPPRDTGFKLEDI
jgi:hypothetical protein